MNLGQATRVLAIRHGETDWNAAARIQGHTDIPLNEVGQWQAERLAAALADEPIDAIYCSDLARARQTALPLARSRARPPVDDAGLRERGFGHFEGIRFDEIERRWPEDAARWRQRDPDFAPGDGETLKDFYARCVGAAERLLAPHAGGTVVLVAHGGVLDCLYRAATRSDLRMARHWVLGNASINRLLHTPQGFSLLAWNDVQHLERPPVDERFA